MTVTFKDKVKPSDFNIKMGLMGSFLNKSEAETVARNIIVISLKNGNKWFPFSFEDYKRHCAPRTNFWCEEFYLEEFVLSGILAKNDGSYSVTERFFRKLADFID